MQDYYDLGNYSRTVSTKSAEAQLWFDRGLIWCYAFNHEEAILCFEKALGHDPDCAMAHWGIAYSIGPNYNKPWEAFDADEIDAALALAREHGSKAQAAGATATPVEQAIIATLPMRYPANGEPGENCPWNDDYAGAMRAVHAAHAADLDVGALFAEALMNRTPWELWDLETGEIAQGADTAEAMQVLENAFANLEGANEHPGLLHMYMHLMEMSPHPERALKGADALRNLVPDAGHLQHMPTHIDVLCGHYQAVVESNQRAILADRKYLDREGALNFYSLYRCHDYHFKIYGAMFLGQYAPALEAAEEMVSTLPGELLRTESPPMADWLEGFVPMKQHVLIRFGKWQEIIDQQLPDDPALFCSTTAMMLYAKTVAYAASGDIPNAEQSRAAFLAAKARVPESRMVFNNTVLDMLAIAEQMLEGELEYRRGNFDKAFEHLRRSVALDDALPYDEPWGWMQPTRHALGALLLEQGRNDEAEVVYRADLGLDASLSRACQHPDNVWSLHGLHECLVKRGEQAEAKLIKQRLDLALARSDVKIGASCFCRVD